MAAIVIHVIGKKGCPIPVEASANPPRPANNTAHIHCMRRRRPTASRRFGWSIEGEAGGGGLYSLKGPSPNRNAGGGSAGRPGRRDEVDVGRLELAVAQETRADAHPDPIQ